MAPAMHVCSRTSSHRKGDAHLHHGCLDEAQCLLCLRLLDLQQRPLLVGLAAELVHRLLCLSQLGQTALQELGLVRDLSRSNDRQVYS